MLELPNVSNEQVSLTEKKIDTLLKVKPTLVKLVSSSTVQII